MAEKFDRQIDRWQLLADTDIDYLGMKQIGYAGRYALLQLQAGQFTLLRLDQHTGIFKIQRSRQLIYCWPVGGKHEFALLQFGQNLKHALLLCIRKLSRHAVP